MEYVRVCVDHYDAGKLYPKDEVIFDPNRPGWKSIFYYNDGHYQRFKRERTTAGNTGQTTDKLVWDFDSKEDVELARKDTVALCTRLIERGVPEDAIQVAFSGNKGFSVEVETDKRFTVEEHREINIKLAEGLATNDTSILDGQRLFRALWTLHQVSKLHKIPISVPELSETPIDMIREYAKSLTGMQALPWRPCTLPDAIYEMRKITAPAPSKVILPSDAAQLDFKSKPKGFSNCKFAVMNGYFEGGNRSNALMALAATCRAQGFPKEVAYNMCKASVRLQADRSGTLPFTKQELWQNIIQQVFSTRWDGGQYTCKNQDWLHDLCQSLGPNRCKDDEAGFITMGEMAHLFEEFNSKIEENTIRTGISAIDENVRLTIGMPVALLGAPSSGKTSAVLKMLEATSKDGVHSGFFSMDMYGPLVYLKQLQRETGYNNEEVHYKHRTDPTFKARVDAAVAEKYKNVFFSLKSGLTVAEMREQVDDYEQRKGVKMKLIVVDYLELISGPFSDVNANTIKIASELKDFATETGRCVFVLVQPQKSAGDAATPLYSMRQIKGASMLEQSFRVVLGIYREGFSADTPQDDRFVSIAGLKNTMGPLFKTDCYWHGVRGDISSIVNQGITELNQLRIRIEEAKKKQGQFRGFE